MGESMAARHDNDATREGNRAGRDSTASLVAADGKIYFASEQGQVRVIKAGPEFRLLAVNDVGDYIMATPAISGGAPVGGPAIVGKPEFVQEVPRKSCQAKSPAKTNEDMSI